MKILHLTSQFFPEYSGSSVRLYHLLSRLPFEVDIIVNNKTIDGEYVALPKEKFGNVNVHRISLEPNGICSQLPFRYFYHLAARSNVKRLISREKEIDIIHAHGTWVTTGEAAMESSKKLKIPFICEIHARRKDYFSGLYKYLRSTYAEYKTRQILHSSSHIITLTYAMKNWIQRYYKVDNKKITVVPNGVDVQTFRPKSEYEEKAKEVRGKLGADNRKIVMYSGYMDTLNGITDLAQFVPEIIHKMQDICFLFVGYGPERDRVLSLSQRYPRNVKFLSPVSHNKMPIYYQMCDLFLIPRPSTISTETLIPLKILEAMAMQKPVLASNVGGITEVIRHRENGYLFEKGDMGSLKQVLMHVLDNDYSQVCRKARKTVVTKYRWEKSVAALREIYQQLL
jgi:glycosyltransferase involved in cell wall biosynthesis